MGRGRVPKGLIVTPVSKVTFYNLIYFNGLHNILVTGAKPRAIAVLGWRFATADEVREERDDQAVGDTEPVAEVVPEGPERTKRAESTVRRTKQEQHSSYLAEICQNRPEPTLSFSKVGCSASR